MQKLIDMEINREYIPSHNEFEDDLKYLAYRMVVELKQLYFIFCEKAFKRSLLTE
jgi:hypothetical protein